MIKQIEDAIQEIIYGDVNKALEILGTIKGGLEFNSWQKDKGTKMGYRDKKLSDESIDRIAKATLGGLKKMSEEEKETNTSSKKVAAMDDARIYVGTYGKYNEGSIKGKWLTLSDYLTYDDFMEDAIALHDDEDDPELMFQDWEGLPDWAISESHLSPAWFEFRDAMSDINDEETAEAFSLYMDNLGMQIDEDSDFSSLVSDFEDAYQGKFKNMEDFAYYLIDQLGGVQDAVDETSLFRYFDKESFVRDLGYDGWDVADEDDAEKNPDAYPDGPGIYENGEFYSNGDSLEDMVDGWMDEGIIDNKTTERYFDYPSFARDLELGGDYYSLGKGYIFRNQ